MKDCDKNAQLSEIRQSCFGVAVVLSVAWMLVLTYYGLSDPVFVLDNDIGSIPFADAIGGFFIYAFSLIIGFIVIFALVMLFGQGHYIAKYVISPAIERYLGVGHPNGQFNKNPLLPRGAFAGVVGVLMFMYTVFIMKTAHDYSSHVALSTDTQKMMFGFEYFLFWYFGCVFIVTLVTLVRGALRYLSGANPD